jgi:alpha/beta superfamily hydrolase
VELPPGVKWEERMVAIARPDAEGESLEGIFVQGASDGDAGAVVAPPHPLYGGSMESPVCNELAWACAKRGIASLRFNWRGVGASSGAPSGEASDADADVAAALAHMAETVPGPLVAAGYSFGAAAVLRAGVASPRVKRLVLVAPPPSLLDEATLGALGRRRALVLAGSADALAPPAALEALLLGRPGVELVVLPGADHFFSQGLAGLARAAADWLPEA